MVLTGRVKQTPVWFVISATAGSLIYQCGSLFSCLMVYRLSLWYTSFITEGSLLVCVKVFYKYKQIFLVGKVGEDLLFQDFGRTSQHKKSRASLTTSGRHVIACLRLYTLHSLQRCLISTLRSQEPAAEKQYVQSFPLGFTY